MWHKDSHGVSPNRPRKKTRKTAKRLATKAAMLKERASKRGKRK